jgi:hypothetical protein
MFFIGTDPGQDNVGLGFLYIFLMGDKLRKQWPTPDTVLMKINERSCAQETNCNCPGNENKSFSFGVKTH